MFDFNWGLNLGDQTGSGFRSDPFLLFVSGYNLAPKRIQIRPKHSELDSLPCL